MNYLYFLSMGDQLKITFHPEWSCSSSNKHKACPEWSASTCQTVAQNSLFQASCYLKSSIL